MTSEQAPGPEGPVRTPVAERRNGLHRFAGRLHEVLDEVGDWSTFAMTPVELVETLVELMTGMSRLGERALSVVADADTIDVAALHGATSTAGLLRALLRLSPREATTLVDLATALQRPEHEPARRALAAGDVTMAQAVELTSAVSGLPATVGVEDRQRASAHLTGEADRHDPPALRRLGKHLHDVIDPDGAEARLAAALEKEERDAARRTVFGLHDDHDGTWSGKFRLPALHGLMLRELLQAFASPARPDPIPRTDGAGQRRVTPEVMGEAFVQLLESFPRDQAPAGGGFHATVVITIPLTTLMGGLAAAAVLGTGHRLSPGQARRLACTAGLIPAVLGGDSEVLDLGRTRRLHTKAQRLAMALTQDGVCAAHGCDRPAAWCDAHHLVPWSHGGHTSVGDGVLLCPRHHTLAHLPGMTLTPGPAGKLRFTRRT